ncbi:MAG: type II toxin-antitoxin system Phd/YefM family antitoxin [Desulfovibrionaceae bacterium]
MKLSESVRSVSFVKANAAEIIGGFAEGREPLVVTQNGEARAVLMGVRQYEEMQESLAMLKLLALSSRDVEEGRTRPAREAFAALRGGEDAEPGVDSGQGA